MPSKKQDGSFSLITLGLLVVFGGCINSSAPLAVPYVNPPSSVSVVRVTLAESSLAPGQSTRATVVATSSEGKVIDGRITLASENPSVATVSGNGVVTAVAAGVTIIRATVSGAVPLSSMGTGGPHNPITSQASWALLAPTNGAVASIRADTAVVTGSGSIEETVSGMTGFASLTVRISASPVTAVTVTMDSTTLGVGHSGLASATAKDASGQILPGQKVSWVSLFPSIATVSSSGVVTGLGAGVAAIQATVSGVVGSTSLVVVTPPDLANHDFNDGTWGPYVHFTPADEEIVDDPTGAGKGKVARFHYAGINQDRNRFLQYQHPVTLGHSLYSRGEFYLPVDSLGDGFWGRKLIFWQNHQDYDKYGANLPTFQMILELFGSDLKIILVSVRQIGGESQQVTNIASSIKPRHWYTLETQVTFESRIGAGDGVARVWLDGALIYENLGVAWTDPAYTGQPVRGGTATPLDAADVYFDAFLVGQQVDLNNMVSYDEYRYWDNVAFSTQRIGR